jgi:hypothetical protein
LNSFLSLSSFLLMNSFLLLNSLLRKHVPRWHLLRTVHFVVPIIIQTAWRTCDE